MIVRPMKEVDLDIFSPSLPKLHAICKDNSPKPLHVHLKGLFHLIDIFLLDSTSLSTTPSAFLLQKNYDPASNDIPSCKSLSRNTKASISILVERRF
ncbi:hypothetical protein EYC84_005982 [Monilinia fructicola]|uniref:Uncharacterized protein n=1 Tax=Monilinia fructicola TaxID=38448 RepID=A0A5M9JYB2_MONFR|nr:hypothetical protein EYC84_005982 [Monilinia fructicola]